MDQEQVSNEGGVVGEYVGKVTGYEPEAHEATVKLRAPVRSGAKVRILSEGAEWDQRLRPRQGLLRRKRAASAEQEIVITVRQPVEIGADVFRLWTAA